MRYSILVVQHTSYEVWLDFQKCANIRDARSVLTRCVKNSWKNGDKRQWRIIRRYITETVVS